MDVQTFAFDQSSGTWSTNELPRLDSSRTLVLVFGAPEIQNQHAIFQSLRDYYPKSRIVGCSTAGEIIDGQLQNGSLVVAVMRFHRTELSTAAIVVRKSEQSRDAATTLAKKLLETGKPSAVLFLGDGVLIDQKAFVEGFTDIVGPGTPVFGAFAGDGDRFERPWVLVGNRLQSGLCTAVAFYGNALSVSSAASTDWGPGRSERYIVTKSEGNVVYQLNQQPALDLCRTPRGARPMLLADDDSFMFTPIGFDDSSKGVAFHRPVPEGTNVYLLDPDAETLISGAASAARHIQNDVAKGPEIPVQQTLALAMSSVGRRLVLGDRAADEILSLSTRLAPETPVIGLYSYGGLAADKTPAGSNAALSLVLLHESFDKDTDVNLKTGNDEATRALPSDYAAQQNWEASGSSASASASSLSMVKPIKGNFGGISASIYQVSNLRLLALSGELNESFEPDELAKHLVGRVVLDLGRIEQITSFGVRGWLQMMEQSKATSLYLASCSEVIVNQMLMVRNFTGGGHVVSFDAPYICTSCSRSFDFTLDVSAVRDGAEVVDPPDVACPDCGSRAVFDDDPESFLEFLSRQSTVAIPQDIKEALADRRLAKMTDVEESIQKQVDGYRTTFRINRPLDEKIRWRRVLAGVEGVVRLDFSGSNDATDTGISRMITELKGIAPDVKEILLDQAHLKVAEFLAASEPIPNIRVRSITIPAPCTNCSVMRLASIDAAQLREARRHGVQPESECRRCSASIPLLVPDPIADYISRGEGGAAAGPAASPIASAGGKKGLLLVAGLAAVLLILVAVFVLTH